MTGVWAFLQYLKIANTTNQFYLKQARFWSKPNGNITQLLNLKPVRWYWYDIRFVRCTPRFEFWGRKIMKRNVLCQGMMNPNVKSK